jgi:hypothetical protein
MITASAVDAGFAPSTGNVSHLSPVTEAESILVESPVWEYSRFADHFRSVLHNRAQRAASDGLNEATVSRYTEAVEILDRAIRAQDIDMIVAYHQHILDAANPGAIETALHVLKPMTTDRKVCSAITKAHIESCAQISESFAVRNGMVTVECHEVITLAFHNLSRTSEIVDLLDQGVTAAADIMNILAPEKAIGVRFSESR